MIRRVWVYIPVSSFKQGNRPRHQKSSRKCTFRTYIQLIVGNHLLTRRAWPFSQASLSTAKQSTITHFMKCTSLNFRCLYLLIIFSYPKRKHNLTLRITCQHSWKNKQKLIYAETVRKVSITVRSHYVWEMPWSVPLTFTNENLNLSVIKRR